MHRYATALRSCRRSRQDWGFRSIAHQLLSTATAVPSISSNGHLEERQSISGERQGLEGKQKLEYDKDIFVNDLSATLEAHRARNRASVIRKIDASPSQFIKRPLLSHDVETDEDGEYSHKTRNEAGNNDASHIADTLGLGQNESLSVKEEDRVLTGHREAYVVAQAVQIAEAQKVQRWPADSVQAQKGARRRGRRGYTSSTEVLEYAGGYLYPDRPWKNVSSRPYELQRPWLLYLEAGGVNALDRLSNEIKGFETYMKLTPAEDAASRLVATDVTSILQQHVPDSSLTLIGSRNTGLATPMSDLDFSISAKSSTEDSEASHGTSPRQFARAAERSLRIVEKHLRASSAFSRPELVHARVPLVTSKHLATGLDIQLQTMAPYQSAQEYTAEYLAELPSLRPLYIILRHSLAVRKLTTVYDGGLGSYTILMMIVTALKHSSGKFAANDLGGQLLHVLNFYANADLYKHGFSANPPRVFDKIHEPRPMEEREARLLDPQLNGIDHILQRRNIRKPYLLALQDPANDLNDLGKNAYAIKHVQATFKVALEGIPKALKERSLNLDSPEEAGSWSCLDFLIKADYKAFEIARSKIQRLIASDSTEEDDSTESIRQDLLDRANDFRAREYASSPIQPPWIRRLEVKPFKNPVVHIPSSNRAYKKKQVETLASRSIVLNHSAMIDEPGDDKVPLDIMEEWGRSKGEQQEGVGQGKERFRLRSSNHEAVRAGGIKPGRRRLAGRGVSGDVEEGGKGF